MAIVKKVIQNKECIIRVEYKGKRKTRVTTFEIPSFITGKQVSAFCEYGEIVDVILGKQRFSLMLNQKVFNAVPNVVLLNRQKLQVIVSGWRPAC